MLGLRGVGAPLPRASVTIAARSTRSGDGLGPRRVSSGEGGRGQRRPPGGDAAPPAHDDRRSARASGGAGRREVSQPGTPRQAPAPEPPGLAVQPPRTEQHPPAAVVVGAGGSGVRARRPSPPLPPPLLALLRAVRPLEEAGYAYVAGARTSAYLQGARVPLTLPHHLRPEATGWHDQTGEEVVEVEVQWDQLATVHAMLGRPGSGWATTHLARLPGSAAAFLARSDRTASGAPSGGGAPAAAAVGRRAAAEAAEAATEVEARDAQPAAATAAVRAAAEAAGGSVAVAFTCAYNTALRSDPARVLVAPRPPRGPRGGEAAGGGPRGGGSSGGEVEEDEGTLEALMGVGGGDDAAAAASGGAPRVWVRSLYSVGVGAVRRGDAQLAAAVEEALRLAQRALSAANLRAWGSDLAYGAWVGRFGPPTEAAARVLQDPGRCLGPLLPYLCLPDSPPLRGLRVANLLGSHGTKAAALAALGAAAVTVVDGGRGNALYGTELAAAAGVASRVSYIVTDVAQLRLAAAQTPEGSAAAAGGAVPSEQAAGGGGGISLAVGSYDVVLLEMGVLHYFLDLRALMRDAVAPLLRPGGGRLLLREFHPVSTKMLSSRGRKHKVTGDYFASALAEADVAFSKYADGDAAAEAPPAVAAEAAAAAVAAAAAAVAAAGGDVAAARPGSGRGSGGAVAAGGRAQAAAPPPPRVLERRWGLGEVVSAVAAAGLRVVVLDEEPGPRLDDAGLPKLFTLVAERPGA